MTTSALRDDRALRFNLKTQKSRALVYALAVLVGLADRAFVGDLQMEYVQAPLLLSLSVGSALLFHELYRHGIDRRLGVDLTPFWMACDIGIITLAVYLSSASSPLFIWYLANTSAAAFVSGNRAALAVGLADSAAYLAVAAFAGPAADSSDRTLAAGVRLVYLFGAGFFFLRGIASIQEKRRRIGDLQREEALKVQELTRLAGELDLRREELNRTNAQLREASLTDALTGLHNRRFLEAQIVGDIATVDRAYIVARNRGVPARNSALGVILMDIDHFKRVNDVHGHDVGDLVLCGSADALRRCARANDALVRWGGEEFLFLARGANPGFLPIVVTRVLRRVREQSHVLPGAAEPLHVTCSVGWSFYPLSSEPGDPPTGCMSWQQVLKLADMALYLAKSNGRNMGVGLVPGTQPIPEGAGPGVLSDLATAVRQNYLRIESNRPLRDLSIKQD